MQEKVRFRCKICHERSWYRPKVWSESKRGKSVKYFWVKCPKCLASGKVRFRKF